MDISRGYAILFLMLLLLFIPGVYGIQITLSGGVNDESGTVSMNFDSLEATALSSQITIDGATITPTTEISGSVRKFEQTHSVKDHTGKSASVYVKVHNAPSGLIYSSIVLPQEGKLKTIEPWVSAEQWLTVPEADSIECTADASYDKLSADVGIELVKGRQNGESVTLTDYHGKAYASDAQIEASQTATDGSANSIKIYGHANDLSGSYSIDTPLTSISGLTASFQDLDALSSSGTTTQVTQKEHVVGKFSSKAVADKNFKIRTSNYGTEYDLNMQAIKGSLPTGLLGYYVNPSMATPSLGAIQGAVDAAQSSDAINAAAGTYSEDVNINKVLTLKGNGNPTATSFTLNAMLGTGSGGITAPIVNVNPGAKIQDGVTFVSSGGTVNLASGTYYENVQIDKSLSMSGAETGSTIVDGSSGGSVFTIGKNSRNIDVALSRMSIQGGSGTSSEGGSRGGGILNHGYLTLSDSSVSGNDAYKGGGIYNTGALNIYSSSVSANTAYYGGGIYNDFNGILTLSSGVIGGIDSSSANSAVYGGGIANSGTINLAGGAICNNIAEWYGGGVLNWGVLNMNSGPISSNKASVQGGGIFNSEEGTLNINAGSSISSNTAETDDGGGIANRGIVIMNGGTVDHNIAQSDGGAIANFDTGYVSLDGGSIDSNIAHARGGGIANWGNLDIGEMSTISGNEALGEVVPGYGGGIANFGTGTVKLSGGSILGNIASSGVGIASEGNVILNKPLGEMDPSYSCIVTVNNGAKIQDGVNLASSGGKVDVAAGTFTENVQIDRSLTVNGAGAGSTIVDGNQAGSVFTIGESDKDVQVTLSGLSITGGSKWYTDGNGGGILNYGKLDLVEVEIFNNYADLGGGICSFGRLNLISGSIHDNSAIRDGGGIRNGGTLFIEGGSIYKNTANWGGGIYDYGTLTMNGGNISGNSAAGWAANGGGICIDRGGTATINGGSITLNNAVRGGGIYRGYIGTNTLILNGGNITGNTPQDVY